VPICIWNCGRRSVLREKRFAKPHTVVPVRSIQRTGNQCVAMHHGRSVPHQYEVRPIANHINYKLGHIHKVIRKC